LYKDIETYGIVKITDKGLDFINKPSFMMSEDHQYNEAGDHAIVSASKSGAIDEVLMGMLRDLRKKVSKKLDYRHLLFFQDPSLEDMALKYPISLHELIHIHGGRRKAKKYGAEFVELINQYVIDNEILRPDLLLNRQELSQPLNYILFKM
jgi:ATP-dependent DNA helicase RecQ